MNNTTFTPADFDNMTTDDEWLGFGYIGGRLHLDATERAASDAVVIREATVRKWNAAQLFTWSNSKAGRHFADCCGDAADMERAATAWGLFRSPSGY